MTALARRRLLSSALATAVAGKLLTRAQPARADFWGGDLPLLAAILAQSIQTVTQVTSMLAQVTYQVAMLKTMLAAVESGSFPALLGFISAARGTYSSLTGGVRSMSYALSRVDAEYNQLFPQAPPAPHTTTIANHQAQYAAWNQEIIGAGQVAARQQTTLQTLDDHAKQTQAILEQSQSAAGVVSQLQLVAQLIGITNSELLLLNQTLATTGRVLTDMASSGASERQLAAARAQDDLDGFTDKGPSVPVPSKLP